jgi:hypothetical protein
VAPPFPHIPRAPPHEPAFFTVDCFIEEPALAAGQGDVQTTLAGLTCSTKGEQNVTGC